MHLLIEGDNITFEKTNNNTKSKDSLKNVKKLESGTMDERTHPANMIHAKETVVSPSEFQNSDLALL